jgi:hypothetical protein
MKRLSGIVLFVVFVLTCHSAYAYFDDWNKLVEGMREFYKAENSDSKTKYYAVGQYAGYVMGVYDATESDYTLPSSGATVKQLCYIVSNFLEKHPERWSEPAARLVSQALRESFPKR